MSLLVEQKESTTTKSNPHKRKPFPYEVILDEEKCHALSKYPDIASRLEVIRRLHLKCVHYEALAYINRLETYIRLKYDDDDEMLELLCNHPRIIKIKSEIKKGDDIKDLMTSTNDEWKLIKDDGKWSTEYKEDKPCHSFRLKGIGNVKMINILAIFYEMDLMANWLPLSKETYEIQRLSLFCKMGYIRVGAFWPFQDREVIVFGFGIDDLKKNDRVLLCFDSKVEQHQEILDKFGIKIPEKPDDRVRVDVTIGGFLLEKVKDDENKTKMTVVWNVDPKVNVPPLILNWFTGQFAARILSSIVETAASIDNDPQYIQRMKENKEFYGAVAKKLSSKSNVQKK